MFEFKIYINDIFYSLEPLHHIPLLLGWRQNLMYLEPTLRTVYWHPCWPQMTSLRWWGSPGVWQVQRWAMSLVGCPPEPPVLLPCLHTRSTGTDILECWPTGPFLTPVTMTVCWRLWLSSTVLWYLSLAGELGCRAKIWGKYCRMSQKYAEYILNFSIQYWRRSLLFSFQYFN